jgi:hypothetical protein
VNIPQNMDKIDLKKKTKKSTANIPCSSSQEKNLEFYISNTWGTVLQMWTQKIELVQNPNIIENMDQMKTYYKKKNLWHVLLAKF